MKKKTFDPREALADKLNKAGINAQTAFLIAVDAGINLVDKDYLVDLNLGEKQLKIAERLIKDFYWGDFDSALEAQFYVWRNESNESDALFNGGPFL